LALTLHVFGTILECMFKNSIRRTLVGSVFVAFALVPSAAFAQSYVPQPEQTPVVLKAVPIQLTPTVAMSDPVVVAKPAPATVEVAPAQITAVDPAVVPKVAVKGIQLTGDSPAFTGSNQTLPLTALGAALFGLGMVLVVTNRRRQTTASSAN
jgi:hypothetical protein